MTLFWTMRRSNRSRIWHSDGGGLDGRVSDPASPRERINGAGRGACLLRASLWHICPSIIRIKIAVAFFVYRNIRGISAVTRFTTFELW